MIHRPPFSRLLLAVDVGNTATSFGLYPLGKVRARPRPLGTASVPTREIVASSRLVAVRLRRAFGGRFPSVAAVVVSSVVPRADAPLRRFSRRHFGARPAFVSPGFPMRVRIRYRRPGEVGADRIVNARGAWALHPGAAIVVDFGTATTFDVVSPRCEYLGGVIAPGPVISAEALYARTAKLPRVVLRRPAKILGHTTLACIESGLYHGYRGLCRNIIGELKRHMGGRPKVFATGGQARWILRGVAAIDRFVPDLTLLGLYHAWHDARRSQKTEAY